MERRSFMEVIAGGLLAAPLVVEAQQAGNVHRIGFLYEQLPRNPPGQGPFYDRLRELGWVYGQNVVIERRAYGDQIERVPELAVELIRLGVDAFVVSGGVAAVRLQQATRTIPIIASNAADLVQFGLAASLAHPGGNVTGIQTLTTDLIGKQLALLKEAIPDFSRAGLLSGHYGSSDPEYRSKLDAAAIREAEASGKTLGIRLQIIRLHRAEELEAAFSAFRDQGAQGILLSRTPFIFTHRKTAVALALKHRLPTASEIAELAMDGGLVSYGFDPSEVGRLLAGVIDKILRGVKAGEIPIQQTTMFRLIINLKTAKALGLTIPSSLLGRADEVIR